MKVTVFGSGYVGLVTGACFAEAGNHVLCVDIDAGKVARLQQGEIPIHEPGLDDLVKRNFEKGRLRFTSPVPWSKASTTKSKPSNARPMGFETRSTSGSGCTTSIPRGTR